MLRKKFFPLLFLAFLVMPARVVSFQTVQNIPLKITSPKDGDVVQGVLAVYGTTDVPGFRSAEISFAYQNNPTSTWFIIQQSSTPVKNDLLTSWDTSTISDGEYQLRVQVLLSDGRIFEKVVKDLRVRNYSPVETSTPGANAINLPPPDPTQTPLADFAVSSSPPTPLPTNPAELTPQNLQESALKGVVVIFIALAVVGAYWGIQTLFRRF